MSEWQESIGMQISSISDQVIYLRNHLQLSEGMECATDDEV